jgi:glycosyltransferase involved in cell wall biosynthesis
MKYDFTIVTPSYNQANFIKETIESVITQSGDFSIQYIVADGGSTDGSVEIIKQYAELLKKKDFRPKCKKIDFIWWSKKDKGQSDAINKGFSRSLGKYVAWINSDDSYRAGAFKTIKDSFVKFPDAKLIYGNFIEIDERGMRLRRIQAGKDFSLDKLVNWGNIVGQPAAFFENKALKKVNYLNPNYHYAMDYDLWVKLAKVGKAVKIENDIANFRLHGDSKTVALSKKFWKEERNISLSNGGKFFSEMFYRHYAIKYPKTKTEITRLIRVLKILLSFNIRLIIKKIKKNLNRLFS